MAVLSFLRDCVPGSSWGRIPVADDLSSLSQWNRDTPFILGDAALECDDDALEFYGVGGVDHGLHVWVGGAEFDAVAVGVEVFDGGFSADEGDDDVSGAGGAFLVDDDDVAV